jgi:putative phage-type endonuclease
MDCSMKYLRRITPSAYLVLSADAPKEDWLAVRRDGITATDIPAILGQSKYKTAIDVWMDKVSPSESTFDPKIGEGEAALWGTVLEDAVARTWADHHNLVVRRIGIICHEKFTWAMASLDRLVRGCPDGMCALEVKTRSTYVADEWEKGVPSDVKSQVEWQLLVSGLDHIHVSALIGGQRLIAHVVYRNDVDLDGLLTKAQLVWDAVLLGQAPELPAEMWTDNYLEQLHPVREGSVEIDPETHGLLTAYEMACDLIKQHEQTKAAIKTQLAGALGEYETALWDGTPVYTYKQSSRKSINAKALNELHPNVASDDRIWSETTSRTLRIVSTKEGK